MQSDSKEQKPPTGLSNDAMDGIAAMVLIALVVAGLVYWLQSMP